jgi:hypothetical protein
MSILLALSGVYYMKKGDPILKEQDICYFDTRNYEIDKKSYWIPPFSTATIFFEENRGIKEEFMLEFRVEGFGLSESVINVTHETPLNVSLQLYNLQTLPLKFYPHVLPRTCLKVVFSSATIYSNSLAFIIAVSLCIPVTWYFL